MLNNLVTLNENLTLELLKTLGKSLFLGVPLLRVKNKKWNICRTTASDCPLYLHKIVQDIASIPNAERQVGPLALAIAAASFA